MTISEIINTTDHRPWDLPQGPWAFYQEWNQALFLHWRVDREALREAVPPELELDLFDEEAWVSLVAFSMEHIRPRRWPAFSPVSNFAEINIRTYVRSGRKAGVYFLSIEGGKWVSCQLAKAISELPYRYSSIRRKDGHFSSRNTATSEQLHLTYQVGEPIVQKSALDRWLTERYALFQDTPRAINAFDIHHEEWPLQEVTCTELEVRYPAFAHLLNGPPELVHYSPGVQVLAWRKEILLPPDKRVTAS